MEKEITILAVLVVVGLAAWVSKKLKSKTCSDGDGHCRCSGKCSCGCCGESRNKYWQ